MPHASTNPDIPATPVVATREHWFMPTAVQLPYLATSVPMLISSTGLHMVPVAAICRVVGLPTALSIKRVRHRLLWHDAELIPLPAPTWPDQPPVWRQKARASQTVYVWCLPYPLSIGYWLGFHADSIGDPVRRAQVEAFVKDATDLSGTVYERVQAQYAQGRQDMFAFHRDLTHLNTLAHDLARYLKQWGGEQVRQVGQVSREEARGTQAGQESRVGQVNEEEESTAAADEPAHRDERTQTHVMSLAELIGHMRQFVDDAQRFVRSWSDQQAHQVVVDAITLDRDGNLIGDPTPFAPLGTFSATRRAQLDQMQRQCAQWRAVGEQILRHFQTHDASEN